MKLPIGMYALSADFQDRSGSAVFTFRDVEYEVVIGENAFENMDVLARHPLEAAQEPFLG